MHPIFALGSVYYTKWDKVPKSRYWEILSLGQYFPILSLGTHIIPVASEYSEMNFDSIRINTCLIMKRIYSYHIYFDVWWFGETNYEYF